MRGIDVPIEQFKDSLNANLYTEFNYTAYGRSLWNAKREDVTPEILIDGSHEYLETLLDDRVDGFSFFLPEPNYESVGLNSFIAKVGLYFAVNLEKLYPTVTERATEYLHEDVIKLIGVNSFEFEGIESGFTAFEKFGLTRQHKDNMQPFYLCKFNLSIQFNYNC